MKLKSKAALGFAAAVVAVGLSAAPASAWSSVSGGNPSAGCWGGFSGSSWYSGSTGYASTGTDGSGCVLGEFTVGAALRTSSNWVTVCSYTHTTKGYCSGSKPKGSYVGGRHHWGGAVASS